MATTGHLKSYVTCTRTWLLTFHFYFVRYEAIRTQKNLLKQNPDRHILQMKALI